MKEEPHMEEASTLVQPELFTQVTPSLWVGGTPANSPGSNAEFDFIVNLSPWQQYPQGEHQIIMTVAMLDSPQVPNENVLDIIADWINAARKIGRVLVHCEKGWNRSPLLVAHALIRDGMKPSKAIMLLREKRGPGVLGNAAFYDWLMRKELHVVH